MSSDALISIGQEAILITLMAAAPMLIAGMVVGLAISIVQSVTQIQEITLSFVPKIVIVMVAFVIFLPWMSELLIEFMQDLLIGLPEMVRPV